MGYMYETGRGGGGAGKKTDYARAERYYRHALESNPQDQANAVSSSGA